MNKTRKILHVDMNSFYASVELLDKPELHDKPVVVGGDESQRHGIVLAKNEIAKSCGIKTAETIYQARAKCPGLVVLPAHHKLYMEYSRKAKKIYHEYSERVQSFGPDEAWIDVSHSRRAAMDLAKEIQQRILSELGLTVSIGVSWNKVFAKMGSDYKKPFAITEITPKNFRTLLWPQTVENLLFVGRKTAQKLRSVNITTIAELARTDAEFLEKFLGKHGKDLLIYARGEDESVVLTEEEQGPAKSIGAMRTTEYDISNLEDIKNEFMLLAEEVSERLFQQNMRAYTIRIYVRDRKFQTFSRQKSFERSFEDVAEIAKIAFDIFKENFPSYEPIRLLGITADKLEDRDSVSQMTILDLMSNKTVSDLGESSTSKVRTVKNNAAMEFEGGKIKNDLAEQRTNNIRYFNKVGNEKMTVSSQEAENKKDSKLNTLLTQLKNEFGEDNIFLASEINDLGEIYDLSHGDEF